MSGRLPGTASGRAAVLAAAVSVACCAGYVVLHGHAERQGADLAPLFAADVVLGTAWPVAGAMVMLARPGNRIGPVLLVSALIGPYLLLAAYAGYAQARGEGGFAADAAAWVGTWGFFPYLVVLPLLLLLFPDGRVLSPGWRPVVLGVLAAATVCAVARMVSPTGTDVAPEVENPLGIASATWLRYLTQVGAVLALFGGVVLGVVAVAVRTRRAVGERRAQLQWLLLGGLLLAIGFLLPVSGGMREVTASLGLLGPPVAIVIAIVRHGLFDVAFALNRTIVFAVLSAAVVGVYALGVLALGSVGATSGPGLLLVAAAALLAATGRTVVQAAVDRMLFGPGRDPYAVVSRVGRHSAAAAEPAEALRLLVDALRTTLRLPYAAFVDDGDGSLTAAAGRPVAGWHAVPALALGQRVGELHAGLRRPGDRLLPEEIDAVTEIAGRAGTLAYAAGLVTDVAQSRARIVLAAQEERRRLRADLHDNVGPSLAGTAHQLDALARRIAEAGGPELGERARVLGERLRATVVEVRDIVHGLRPPVVDQAGLAGALRGLTDGYEVPRCTAEVGELPALPAGVEVNAYAIAAEAVANAVRHSAGSSLRIGATVQDGVLVVEVADNGCGMPANPPAGVGLRSMGERAAEVGGRLDVLAVPGGGTLVRARLPLRPVPPAGPLNGAVR